jgi:hypothetical protein
MTQTEIEHMWKVASNDPNHDTNWNDAVVIAFANLVAQHEREACAKVCEDLDAWNMYDPSSTAAKAIRARGETK